VSRRAPLLCVPPGRDDVLCLRVNLDPRHRVRERRAVGKAARDSRWQRWVEQPRRQIHDLSQAFHVSPGDRQDPETHPLLIRAHVADVKRS